MAIYLCYGCDEMKDGDYDPAYESIGATRNETGEMQYQCCCEDCHNKEVEKYGEKCMACDEMAIINNECDQCGAKSVPLQNLNPFK